MKYTRSRLQRMKQRRNQQILNTVYVVFSAIALVGVGYRYNQDLQAKLPVKAQSEMISPLPSIMPSPAVVIATPKPTPSPTPQPETNVDDLVRKYVHQYFTNESRRSEMKMIMHCLLNRESVHGNNKGHGDAGKAGGPLQYWEGTWIAYRELMIADGLIKEVGSRYNMDQAIETTVWAISTGRGYAWGPILRDSQGKTNATCPTPTWY